MHCRERQHVFLPHELTADAHNIQLEPDAVPSHVPHVGIHAISMQGRPNVCVRTPLVVCHNVVRTDDQRVHMLIDANDETLASMVESVDNCIVQHIAKLYDIDVGMARMRYLSAIHTKGTKRIMKVRVPMTHDVLHVGVFDDRGNPIEPDSLWECKRVPVIAVMELEAAWVVDDAAWIGTNWKLRQLLVKHSNRTSLLFAADSVAAESDEKTDAAN